MSGPEMVATVGVGAALVTFVYVGLLALRTRPRSPQPGRVTMDLGDEPPAVVDLLTDGFEPTPEAVPATVLDLAARRWLTIEQYGDAAVLIRLRSAGRGQLQPFEEQVLAHLNDLAIDGVVPGAALTTGPEEASAQWWSRFRKAVVNEARREGLCRPRWSGAHAGLAWLGVIVAFVCGWIADNMAGDVPAMRLVDVLALTDLASAFALGAIATAITRSDRQRETDRGLVAAGRWLGVRQYLADHADFAAKPAAAVALWDRYLAYAVALDLAPLATAQLPLGAEDDRHAWSRKGRTWRHVVVSYPRARPGYGQHPLVAAIVGAVTAAAATLGVTWLLPLAASSSTWFEDLPPEPAAWVRRVAGLLVVALFATAVWSTLKMLFGFRDLFSSGSTSGVVLRARVRETGDWLPAPLRVFQPDVAKRRRRFFLAVDDGEEDRVRAWRVRREIYSSTTQGDFVEAVVTPALGYVRTVVRSEPRPSAAVTVPASVDDPDFVAAVQARARS